MCLYLGISVTVREGFPSRYCHWRTQKVKNYVKAKGYDFEEVSARTAEKLEATIKNFGKKIADKKFKKAVLPITSNSTPTSTSSTTPSDSARNAGVHLKSPSSGAGEPKKKEGCC